MARNLLWMLLLLIFLLQGTVMHWIIPSVWQTKVFIAPHFTLTVVLYIGLYVGRHMALAYGIAFGLLQDFIFYGHMLGVYSFGMGLTGYLVGLMERRIPGNLFYNLLLIGFGQFLFDAINYGLNRLFNITHEDFRTVLSYHMLPNVLFNLLFALIIYVPVRKLLERVAYGSKPQDED
jgi:rod shape-determining protein MreD